MGSRLVQTVTAEDLADSMSAFNLSYHDSGLFGVYGVTDRWDMGLRVAMGPLNEWRRHLLQSDMSTWCFVAAGSAAKILPTTS